MEWLNEIFYVRAGWLGYVQVATIAYICIGVIRHSR